MTPQAEAICIEFVKWVYAKPKRGWCCDSFDVVILDFLKYPEYILKHYDFTKGTDECANKSVDESRQGEL